MADQPFVHLHCHTHYSLLDGANRVPELVAKCKELGMSSVAVTDHGNLYGAMELLKESKAAGIKPIIGIEAYIAPGRRSERVLGGCNGREYAYHITLLAKNGAGLRNLIRLSSKAFLEGYYYKPRIDKEILEQHSEGLICLSGCCSSELADLVMNNKRADAEALCQWYLKVFGKENFFMEIQDNGVSIQHETNAGVIDVARRMGLPLVGTSDAHYLTKEDAKAHDVLLCVNMGKTFDEHRRLPRQLRQPPAQPVVDVKRTDGRTDIGSVQPPRVMPAAARVLGEAGVPATSATGTGPGGRVTKSDAVAATAKPAAPAAVARPAAVVPAKTGGSLAASSLAAGGSREVR